MTTPTKRPLAGAVGAAFIASIAFSQMASAVANPFQINQLSSGYSVAEAGKMPEEGKCGEGKCGEGKCGANKAKEGKCGADKAKEGKCGADKAKEGKCGADKAKEGKCGEGKCGAKKE